MPYSYGFESDMGAAGWTMIHEENYGYNGRSWDDPHWGTYGFQFDDTRCYADPEPGWEPPAESESDDDSESEEEPASSGVPDTAYLLSPLLSGTTSGVVVSFWYKGVADFYVGYTTDENNTAPSTYTYGTPVTASGWQEYVNTFPPNTKRIAVKFVHQCRWYLSLDDFSFEDPACATPTDLAALAVIVTPGGTNAILNWTPGGTETEWIVEYGTVANFTGATSQRVSTTPTLNLTGLTANTYYVRVKTVCGEGDGSNWSNVCSFTPSNASDAYSITVNDGSATNKYVPIYGSGVADNVADDLKPKSQFIIPAATLSSIQGETISKMTFYATDNPSWNYAQFKVYMMETDQTTLSELADWNSMTQVMNAANLHPSGNQMVVTLDAPYQYSGGNLMIGIRETAKGTSGAGANFYGVSAPNGASWGGGGSNSSFSPREFLPKVTFGLTPPSCTAPTDLAAIVTPRGTNVILNWTAGGTETEWTIQYSTTSDFSSGVSSTTATTNPTSLTGFTSGTRYYARVKAVCGEGDSSKWSNVCTFTPSDTSNAYSITVNDGLAFNDRVPIYGSGVDNNTALSQSRFIIPAATLSSIQGATISKMTFYADANPSWADAQFQVYMRKTNQTTMSVGFDSWNNLTQVTNAVNLHPSGNQMVVTLTRPYQYSGGNLMIGIWETGSGTAGDANFYGVSAPNGASMGGGATTSSQEFLPKVTFEFTLPAVPVQADKWYAISTPMHDAGSSSNDESVVNVENLTSGTYDFLRYNEHRSTWESQKSGDGHTGFNSMEPGRGYIYRRANDAVLKFDGEPNTGNVEVGITKDVDGWNLVGNPYNTSITRTSLTGGAALASGGYTLNTNGTWTAFDNNATIAVGQAFLVKATAAGMLNFSAPAGAKGATATEADADAHIRFTVSNDEFTDVAYALFADGEGLPKISHLNAEAPMLSIATAEGDYAIAMMEESVERFPLHFNGQGRYTLRVDNNAGLGYLHLIDRATGRDIDLLATPEYSFTGTGLADRFVVRLLPDMDENGNVTFVHIDGNRLVVDGEGELQVFDVVGRQLGCAQVSGTATLDCNSLGMTNAGVYVMRLGGNSQKIVVR